MVGHFHTCRSEGCLSPCVLYVDHQSTLHVPQHIVSVPMPTLQLPAAPRVFISITKVLAATLRQIQLHLSLTGQGAHSCIILPRCPEGSLSNNPTPSGFGFYHHCEETSLTFLSTTYLPGSDPQYRFRPVFSNIGAMPGSTGVPPSMHVSTFPFSKDMASSFGAYDKSCRFCPLVQKAHVPPPASHSVPLLSTSGPHH